MNIYRTLTIFFMALTGLQIAAMQQPNLRQQLTIAANRGNNEQAEELMLSGAPVAPETLFCTTFNGHYDVAKTIFEYGVDPESPADPNQMFGGLTLFISLVLNPVLQPQVKEKLIKLYLKHGADIELLGPSGHSILIDKVNDLDFNTLKLLLEQGAYANAQDNRESTALMSLALSPIYPSFANAESEKVREQKLKEKAGLLIQYGADVNLQDTEGETCLMKAIWRAGKISDKTFVEFLLENGARVDLQDMSGLSALDHAKDQPEILKLLKDAQKTTNKKSCNS